MLLELASLKVIVFTGASLELLESYLPIWKCFCDLPKQSKHGEDVLLLRVISVYPIVQESCLLCINILLLRAQSLNTSMFLHSCLDERLSCRGNICEDMYILTMYAQYWHSCSSIHFVEAATV